ncbi:MAG: proline--tRNA ligase [Thermoleophilia bacterium]|nr:proline--tRNA ligase [Thermoleophilia bacterium]
MIARASKLFLPTLRDDPADAEAVNHRLLVRGGFVRQVIGGVWTFLPLGWRVHRKIEQIIREEMDAIGSQEMLMPVLTPAELWRTSGRYSIPELFHLQDRKGTEYVLPMTHEETVTWHAREIRSYRDMPQLLYHFSVKERDEPRPRAGLIRLREFIMKDSYSFDRDAEGLDVAFELNRGAYHRIFDRVGLQVYAVEAESGMMGGSESIDFLAPANAGENTLVTCENGDYAADLEVARSVPRAPEFPPELAAPEEIETPNVRTCEALAEFLGIDLAATTKAMPVTRPNGTVVLGLLRGDDRLEEAKLFSALGSEYRPSTDEEIRAAFGAEGGSLGPVGFEGEVVADELLRGGQFVSGANRTGWHLRGVQHGRDYEATFADLRQARAGDRCPKCGGALHFQTAIEVGHIFKLGTRFSKPLDATYVDEDGTEKPIVMGSYGIGLERTMAAVVEQQNDEHGIIWPASIAPYGAHVVVLKGADEIGEQAASALDAAGLEVLLDDRDQRPGEKFADADLIGIPLRVTAGKKSLEDGAVDVRNRATGDERRVNVAELGENLSHG